MPWNQIRLTHQGEDVPFHIEPERRGFGRGSTLYFVSEGAALNPYGREAVYELELGREGRRMPVSSASPSGPSTDWHWYELEREENRIYASSI